MAITYGFYNSMNGDRKYNALQMSSIFDGVIRDGVFQSIGGYLATKPGEGMQVIVSPGKAWFDHTWTVNDADLPLEIAQSDLTLSRYDAVVLETDATKSVRENSIKVLKGTPASDPQKPTLINKGDVHQHPLAYILVPGGSSSIQVQNIDIMVGKAECPFVTSILESVSIDVLLAKWEGEFRVWFDELQNQMDGDVATNLQNQITRNAPSVGDIVVSYNDDKKGPWLHCGGKSFDKSTYPELYEKLKSMCSFEKNIPIVPGFEYVVFVEDKGFFFDGDQVYISESLWKAPNPEHTFSMKTVFQGTPVSSSSDSFSFGYVNGNYVINVQSAKYLDSKLKFIYAHSTDGYNWTVEKVAFGGGTSATPALIDIKYHRNQYAFLYKLGTGVYVSYADALAPSSISEGTYIGSATVAAAYLSEDGQTLYVLDTRAGSSSQNWKIDNGGKVTSIAMYPQGSAAQWVYLFEYNGSLYKVWYSTSGSMTFDVDVTKEGLGSSRLPGGVTVYIREGTYGNIGLDVAKSDGNVYIFIGSYVYTIENDKIELVTDAFPFYTGYYDASRFYKQEYRSLNTHYLIADWKKSMIFSSACRTLSLSGATAVFREVRTNSPEITPYVEAEQGLAYIRSEK